MENVIQLLKETRKFYLATIENGQPKIRPFGAFMEYENKFYFNTANNKDVYKQIISNPNVAICACNDSRKWVRIEGIAKLDERIIAKQRMLDENPVLVQNKRFAGAEDPTMAIFYIDNAKVMMY